MADAPLAERLAIGPNVGMDGLPHGERLMVSQSDRSARYPLRSSRGPTTGPEHGLPSGV